MYEDCNKPFRFGERKPFIASKAATMPPNIGPHKVGLKTHIVDTNIPLLLSRSAIKKGEIELKFSTDTIIFLGDEIPLNITSSGLYHLPLTPSKQLLEKVNKNLEHHPIILRATENKSNKEIAVKLHRSFAHPSAEKLLKLINNSGQEWSENADLKKEIKEVTINCEICKRYKKAPPRPVVSLPIACQFQETVAMDLKYYQSHIFLHLIDMCKRLSAATFVPNKNKDTILKAIFRIWIAVYGSPDKILVDNGGEFANSEFIETGDYFGINIQTTAAEFPWSNGIVERNN